MNRICFQMASCDKIWNSNGFDRAGATQGMRRTKFVLVGKAFPIKNRRIKYKLRRMILIWFMERAPKIPSRPVHHLENMSACTLVCLYACMCVCPRRPLDVNVDSSLLAQTIPLFDHTLPRTLVFHSHLACYCLVLPSSAWECCSACSPTLACSHVLVGDC